MLDRRRRPSLGLVLLVLSLVIFLAGVAGVADAATGGNFILGQKNTADAKTILSAPYGGPALQVSNTSTATGATAMELTVAAGKAPLTVNSATKVANLNADRLDSLDSTAFQKRITANCPTGSSVAGVNADGSVSCSSKAADADLLDGRDSTSFMLGSGEVYKGARAILKNSPSAYEVLSTATPDLTVYYSCPADLSINGTMVFINHSPELVNVFSDNGTTNPEYRQLPASGGRWDQFMAAGGEHITIQVQGSFTVTTFQIFSVHRPSSNDCHVEAQAVVSR
jgi:hypothetical protein